MSKCKVKDSELKELSEIYNTKGRKAVYELLNSKYGIKNPYFVIRRMCEYPGLSYDAETDQFLSSGTKSADDVFMSMDELCSPVIPQHFHISNEEHLRNDSRPAAMDNLIRELIGDQLLELSKYVTIDSLSKRIIVDKIKLETDGYQLITH